MWERRAESNDRRAVRRYPISGRLTWKDHDGTPPRNGLLTEMSFSSVAFITRGNEGLRTGETIFLSTAAESNCPYRIARVAPYDAAESLVICTPVNSEGEG